MKELLKNKESKAWIILIFLSIIWGTSFILIKKSLVAFSPQHVAALRVGISALAFMPFFFIHFKNLKRLPWWKFLIIGLSGTAIPAFLFSTAQTEISSSISGILNSLTPIFTLLFGIFAFQFATHNKQILGVVMGFIGAFLLVYFTADGHLEGQMFFGLLIVIATVCYGLNVNLIKYFFQKERAIVITSLSFVITGVPILLYIIFSDIPHIVMHHDQGWICLFYVTILALMSTVFALLIFYKLVQDTSPIFASMVSYLIPVVAMIWGFLDGETIGWYHFIGFALIMSGIYLVKEKRKITIPNIIENTKLKTN